MDCVFCKIVCGEIPSMKVYEDDWTIAFMDIAKDVDGHILVIPGVLQMNNQKDTLRP